MHKKYLHEISILALQPVGINNMLIYLHKTLRNITVSISLPAGETRVDANKYNLF